ncbi:short chain enoyl-CoA hydratase /3-hydroxyacyl-CoA dehydrogenase [Pseudomonas sp. SJZ079]|uniref:3-hydroxyacyl-CoA dehydrogenase NAD-binding domain-containing protein n=1 Tax=Pseudomonas sp. SJZ079 TaxID=2572887 RepID=UPI00119A03F4|nr:3-hydroxyacyl-CoA dehydrogenase NAD-binding domain-containing protein [Pseudomonas sp. SJZ079]TWC26994.1 short chain enoyl-CoA hydratase /3-hydroxyacyl-CoA dehydrogenase [Pseudomonas sp. SJZ079]
MFVGSVMSLQPLAEGIVHWAISTVGAAVNTLSEKALDEWEAVLDQLETTDAINGLVITSDKTSFIVGADVKEFPAIFEKNLVDILAWAKRAQQLCNRIENLPFPTVAAINGAALGGGLEFALATDFRLATADAVLGLPEVTLGLCPGWGGSVRLTRIAGMSAAAPLILSGAHMDATAALKIGVIDKVAPRDRLLDEAIALLGTGHPFAEAKIRRALKKEPLTRVSLEPLDTFPTRGKSKQVFTAIYQYLGRQARLTFKEALEAERILFANLAKGDVSKALIGLFIIEHHAKSAAKKKTANNVRVERAGVIGAGVMGGGIVYQIAAAGVEVSLKDVNPTALQLGVDTVAGYLDKQVSRGRISQENRAAVAAHVSPGLDWVRFDRVNIVIEAVVERLDVKADVLSQAEARIPEQAILTSNTSTLSIDLLAEGLTRPANFCGMHFFNPVPMMALVEVVKGSLTSDQTITSVEAFALNIGKQPIVVKDCPGFLVNRILFPYFNAFNLLLLDGVECKRIDQVMEDFGWPMGPAHLADIIGLDVMVHADKVIQEGYPSRMRHHVPVAVEYIYASGLLGQKKGAGFYEYERSSSGHRPKDLSPVAKSFLSKYAGAKDVTDQQIIDRLMAPLCMEAVRCLDEGIVASAADADLGAILGLGFPRFRGGPLRYIDQYGLERFIEMVRGFQALGSLYEVPSGLFSRIGNNAGFYQ